jgi:Arc/MetJ-type ribon-helix-helix transcriptional regulator
VPTINVSEEVLAAIDAAVLEGEYADATEYVTRLVRQDQKRRAKEQLLASLSTGEEGDGVDALADAWRRLRVERHRLPDDE